MWIKSIVQTVKYMLGANFYLKVDTAPELWKWKLELFENVHLHMWETRVKLFMAASRRAAKTKRSRLWLYTSEHLEPSTLPLHKHVVHASYVYTCCDEANMYDPCKWSRENIYEHWTHHLRMDTYYLWLKAHEMFGMKKFPLYGKCMFSRRFSEILFVRFLLLRNNSL